jgi:hypothetical protein
MRCPKEERNISESNRVREKLVVDDDLEFIMFLILHTFPS